MASPPPNPDTRPLPPGWVQQYNWEYRAWFYVNTREQPPQSSWVHPLGPPGPPAGYASPPYTQGYQSPGNYNNSPQSGYAGGYQQAPASGRGFFGGSGGYSQQQPPKKPGMGMGGAALAGGAGLLGGALLMNACENHEEHLEEQAYYAGENQGYDQGYDNGFDAGFDDGGGF